MEIEDLPEGKDAIEIFLEGLDQNTKVSEILARYKFVQKQQKGLRLVINRDHAISEFKNIVYMNILRAYEDMRVPRYLLMNSYTQNSYLQYLDPESYFGIPVQIDNTMPNKEVRVVC